jgi:hypothetical protein
MPLGTAWPEMASLGSLAILGKNTKTVAIPASPSNILELPHVIQVMRLMPSLAKTPKYLPPSAKSSNLSVNSWHSGLIPIRHMYLE